MTDAIRAELDDCDSREQSFTSVHSSFRGRK